MDSILTSFKYNVDYLNLLVDDLSLEQMVQQPEGLFNHAAWTIGHVTYSMQSIGHEIGLAPWLPNQWAHLYGQGSIPVNEVTTYGTKEQIVSAMSAAVEKLTERLQKVPSQYLDAPLPDENFRAILPTRRHAVNQVLVAHSAYHAGQLVVWRRACRLPAINVPFL